jgi:integrase
MSELLLDRAGRWRSPATMPGFHAGRPPRNKGLRYPAGLAVGGGGHRRHARRRRRRPRPAAARPDCDPVARWASHPGSTLSRRGRSRSASRRPARPTRQGRTTPRSRHGCLGLGRAAALARTAAPASRRTAVLRHQRTDTRRHWSSAAARADLHKTAVQAGVRRRFAPHQLRHAHAVELAREGVPLIVIQRQLGHSNLGITSVFLQGIDNAEIIETVHARRQPMIPVRSSLE